MAIRILPDSEIKQAASSFHNPPLLFANPKNLYQRRAERLRALANKSPLTQYMLFAAQIADIQLRLLEQFPITTLPDSISHHISQSKGLTPLHAKYLPRDKQWLDLLYALLSECKQIANETSLAAIEWLEKASTVELEELATALLNEQFEKVSADKAVFIWAALSLYWVQLTQLLPRHANSEKGDDLHRCPVCDSAPVTSVVHFGNTQGLRYLHCSLCESEWHIVRAKCSHCEQSGKLDYWSLDTDEAIKAESCGDCQSYLKILYQEKDPHTESVADDLASIYLDAEMEQKGFARSGLNPFLFQNE